MNEKDWIRDIANFRANQIRLMIHDKKFIVIKGKTFEGSNRILVPVPKERREEAGLQSELEVLEVINELRKKAGLPPLK